MKVLLLVAFLLVSSAAGAQTLWRDLPAGATLDQVRKALPDAHSPDKPGELADGITIGLLEVTGFRLADLDFKAQLFFKNGKLDQIVLTPIERPIGMAARVAASKLRDSLIAKYGKPVKDEPDASGLGHSYTWAWIKDGTQILLRFAQYGTENVGFLQVTYWALQDTENL